MLREFLGLGEGPIEDIFTVIEKKLGIRLYQCNLGENSKVWGIYSFDERLGACMLLNAKYFRPWRILTAAHELGHFMGDRKKIAVDEENCESNAREERYARNFSYAFTLPESSFGEAFSKMSDNSMKMTNVTFRDNSLLLPCELCCIEIYCLPACTAVIAIKL